MAQTGDGTTLGERVATRHVYLERLFVEWERGVLAFQAAQSITVVGEDLSLQRGVHALAATQDMAGLGVGFEEAAHDDRYIGEGVACLVLPIGIFGLAGQLEALLGIVSR